MTVFDSGVTERRPGPNVVFVLINMVIAYVTTVSHTIFTFTSSS